MNKKGFTLVELLAVIAILAILVIIALPNVLGMFNDAKKNSFMTEAREIYKQAGTQWLSSSLVNSGSGVTYTNVGDNPNPLSLNGRSDITYCVEVDNSGHVTSIKVGDASYKYAPTTVPSGAEEITADTISTEDGTITACPNKI